MKWWWWQPSHEVIYSRVISASGLVASPAVTHWDMCCTPLGLRAVCYCPFESVSQWCHTGHLLVNNWLQQMMCFQKNRVTRTLHLLQNMVAGFILLSLIEVINGADITMMSDIWLWTRAVFFISWILMLMVKSLPSCANRTVVFLTFDYLPQYQ